jgi:hypothetical protein
MRKRRGRMIGKEERGREEDGNRRMNIGMRGRGG